MHAGLGVDGWAECAAAGTVPLPASLRHAHPHLPPLPPVTSVAFDPASELLWSADAAGRVASYFGPSLEPYTRCLASPRAGAGRGTGGGGGAGPGPGAGAGRSNPDRHARASAWASGAGGPVSAASISATGATAPAHALAPPPYVSAVLPDDRLIFSANSRGIHAINRRGLSRWSLSTADAGVPSLRIAAMCDNASSGASELVAAGASQGASFQFTSGAPANSSKNHGHPDDVVLAIAKSSGRVVRKAPTESDAPITHMRSAGRVVVTGTSAGQLQFRDPRTLKSVHRLAAHPGGLIDLAAEGNLVYSVGWTIRLGHPVAEPFVKVTDMRAFRALASVPFAAPGGPGYLAIHPRLSGTVVVASPTGLFQIVDSGNPGQSVFHHVQTSSSVSALAMAPTGDYIAFGCQDGSVKLWSSAHPDSTPGLRFNAYDSDPPVVPDTPLPPPVIQWDKNTPLSNIGMPFYAERLLSYTPLPLLGSHLSPLFSPPARVDSKLLSHMRPLDGKLFGPTPRNLLGKRNVVPDQAPTTGAGAIPLFRSEQTKLRSTSGLAGSSGGGGGSGSGGSTDLEGKSSGRSTNPSATGLSTDADAPPAGAGSTMPPYYRTQMIQYSKFGIEDFDFGLYNKTQYSGLETHIQNCYANSLLQALHYLYPLRHLAAAHTTIDCPREDCLLCEAGFLFRMLSDARGENCQASNFFRAFSHLPQAQKLGLLDPEEEGGTPAAALVVPSQVAWAHVAQKLNWFLLDSFAAEAGGGPFLPPSPPPGSSFGLPTALASYPIEPNLIKRLFTIRALTKSTCGTCYISGERESSSLVCDLIYPRKALSNEVQQPSDFASVLKQALTRPVISKMMCRMCQTPHAAVRTRRVLGSNDALPPILSLHAGITSLDAFSYWLAGSRNTSQPTFAATLGLAMSSAGPSASSAASTGAGLEQTMKPEAASPQPYLPPMFDINVVGETIDIKPVYTDGPPPPMYVRYLLRSMVAQIQADKEHPHLVTFARTSDTPAGHVRAQQGTSAPSSRSSLPPSANPQASAKLSEGSSSSGAAKVEGDWVLFNDFLVKSVPQSEALAVHEWKVPSVLFFEKVHSPLPSPSQRDVDVTQLNTHLDPALLCRDFNMAPHRQGSLIRHVPLLPSELPGSQEIPASPPLEVAIDAEFVALRLEETEVRSDGTKSLVRPVLLSPARISVVRGWHKPDLPLPPALQASLGSSPSQLQSEPLPPEENSSQGEPSEDNKDVNRQKYGHDPAEEECRPFIDDHIETRTSVVDYLTRFSGIQPGDLSVQSSRHTLVPLKVAYKKLRALVDMGAKFIGHGLSKDFRIINLYVPPEQVIDTVDLYRYPGVHRKVSLKFLTWFLLKRHIQASDDNPNQGMSGLSRHPSPNSNATVLPNKADPSSSSSPLSSHPDQADQLDPSSSSGTLTPAVQVTSPAGHDSIEDASAALHLYRLYEQFERTGRLHDVLEDLYETGRRLHWRPPAPGSSTSPSE